MRVEKRGSRAKRYEKGRMVAEGVENEGVERFVLFRYSLDDDVFNVQCGL
jgi:hypothetical protein